MRRYLDRRAILHIAGAVSANAAIGCALEPEEGPRGYPRRPSVLPGDTLTLHVSTTAPWLQVEFYRQGATLELVGRSPWYPGRHAPPRRADEDWGWPELEFAIPRSWRPGCYIAMLVEGDPGQRERWRPTGNTTWGRHGKIFFVLRNGGKPAPMLYKIALATFQAYNYTGGASLYGFEPNLDNYLDGARHSPPLPTGMCVSMRRPGDGTGGDFRPGGGVHDFYDESTPMNCFEHLDAYLVRWLEARGYPVDYCVDWDVQTNPAIFDGYRLVVCAGHDEYWSETQREAHERHVKGGGNIAFFTGNTCWWRIHYIRDNTAIVRNRWGEPVAGDQWYGIRPENAITGVSYRHGGSWWPSKRKPLGFTVEQPSHWAFEGTNLAFGDKFGDAAHVSVVGVECDGCPWHRVAGVAVPRDHANHGTPENFTILATAEIHGWPTHYGQGATMGMFSLPGGGTVFNVATTDWNRCISLDRRIERITQNVLMRLADL